MINKGKLSGMGSMMGSAFGKARKPKAAPKLPKLGSAPAGKMIGRTLSKTMGKKSMPGTARIQPYNPGAKKPMKSGAGYELGRMGIDTGLKNR